MPPFLFVKNTVDDLIGRPVPKYRFVILISAIGVGVIMLIKLLLVGYFTYVKPYDKYYSNVINEMTLKSDVRNGSNSASLSWLSIHYPETIMLSKITEDTFFFETNDNYIQVSIDEYQYYVDGDNVVDYMRGELINFHKAKASDLLWVWDPKKFYELYQVLMTKSSGGFSDFCKGKLSLVQYGPFIGHVCEEGNPEKIVMIHSYYKYEDKGVPVSVVILSKPDTDVKNNSIHILNEFYLEVDDNKVNKHIKSIHNYWDWECRRPWEKKCKY